jgi:hypothetical protein
VTLGKWILGFACGAIVSLMPGCGSSTTNVQNQPAPSSSSVSIAFQPAPTATVPLNATTTLTAVVTNDSSNAGVDWSLLCANSSKCGTLSPLHTASGSPATYTPPASISGNNQTVTIEAFATADHNQNVVTPITVTGFASTLKGTYVFLTQGSDANGAYQLAGVIVLDGNGGITSGEQTHGDSFLSVSDPVTGGAYNVGPDGRGTLTINTADANIGQQGVENLSMVVLSNSQALIATLDDPNLQSSIESSAGTMDLQTSKAAPGGGYAFSVGGIDISLQPMVMGGVFNIDSPGAISGAGSVADQDDAGFVFPSAALSGTTGNPDSFGSLKFNLTTDFAPAPLQFTGYIVDSTHIKLIESDIDGTGAGFGATAGVAIGQGTATGTFTANKSFAGKYVFGVLGEDLSGLPSSLASVGKFTSDKNGNITGGFNDEFLAGLGVEISDSFTGTYTLDSSGTGRVDSNINFNKNGPGPEFIFYLTGNGNPPLVLDADVNIGSLGVGLAYPQAASPFSFNGKYGLSFTQNSGGIDNDATGQITVVGSSSTLSGVIDTNLGFSPQPNTPLTGTFGTIPNSGHFSGTLTNTFFPTPGNMANTLPVAFYLIDSNHGFFIETDSQFSGELSVGYFAARTPVCQGCQ